MRALFAKKKYICATWFSLKSSKLSEAVFAGVYSYDRSNHLSHDFFC